MILTFWIFSGHVRPGHNRQVVRRFYNLYYDMKMIINWLVVVMVVFKIFEKKTSGWEGGGLGLMPSVDSSKYFIVFDKVQRCPSESKTNGLILRMALTLQWSGYFHTPPRVRRRGQKELPLNLSYLPTD